MNYRKIGHWKLSELGDGFIFCIQRLDELLFDYTIDSYKPRALNTPSLCIELLKVIGEVENGNIDEKNISTIIEELKESIKKDKVAKVLVNAGIDYFTAYNDEHSLSDLRLKISVLERSLERYRYIRDLQNKLFEAVQLNNKNEIDLFISNYVTTFINWGISKQFIYKQMNKHFFDPKKEINTEDQLLDFFKIMSPKTHTYSVCFKVSRNIKLLEKSFDFFGIRTIDPTEDKLKEVFERRKFKPKGNEIIIEIAGIKHPDPYMARHVAEKRLETIRNTSNLYFHNTILRWNKNALVIQKCCNKLEIIAQNQINPMKKSFNYKSNEVAKKTNKIFQNIALEAESFKKFNRILELHSNSLQNLTPENQLVNLWIILETITPSTSKKSKVKTICNAMLPILLLRYFNKLISTLLSDLSRWNDDAILSYIKDVPSETDTLLAKFSIFLASEEFDDRRKKLYDDFDNFHLLRNRTFKLSNILQSKEKILAHLDSHKMNITWQIRRVYRTRNMIVHSGKSPEYINILIENTHDYIDQVVSEIIDMATSNYRINSLEQAFELGKILHIQLDKKIKESSRSEDYALSIIREDTI